MLPSPRSLARTGNLPKPPSASGHLHTPLTSGSISAIRSQLESAKGSSHGTGPSDAAVLIPLCNVGGRAGVLMEVRGKLRMHGGEVRLSFPGGKLDRAETPVAAAVRETQEELGIFPEQIEVLGEVGPQERTLSGLRVRPYVAFVSPLQQPPTTKTSPSTPLPDITLASLTPSPIEVADVFHLSFDELLDHSRLRPHLFRSIRPYWAVDVSDKVASTEGRVKDGPCESLFSGGQEGQLEVWGLTGWYLSLLMRALEIW